jgi:hypothetical protein
MCDVTNPSDLGSFAAMSQYLTYQCPETGDTVQFRTMTIKDCTSCQGDHMLEKADLALGPEAPH